MSMLLWLHNLAAWSGQTAALIVAGALAAWVFRVHVARIRLYYWHALMAICLLLPALEPWRAEEHAGGDISITSSPARSAPVSAPAFPWRAALLAALASGCAARGLWLAVGFRTLRRRRQTARAFDPLPAGLDRLRAAVAPEAEFLLSSAISGPVTFGFRRPVVVLPDRFHELPPDVQEAVACHELLHVRRHDWLFTVGEEFIRAALWFHPAVWWLISQVQLAREQTVDAEVVAFTRNRAQYLNALLALAGRQPALDLAPAALFLKKRHLKKRVALLLKEVTMSKRRLISFCATSCGLLFAAGWLAFHTFPLQAAPAPQEDSKLLHSVPPEYPRAAREKRIEGAVVLELHIDADGHVADAQVLSGPEELRAAAMAAVLQWHYSPKAMTLPATTRTTVEFRLPKDGAAESDYGATLAEGKRVTLNSIDIDGLNSSARDELLQRITVHVGDTVDSAALRALAESVRTFDDHLRLSLSAGDSGRLRIFLPPPAGPEERAQGIGPNRIRVGSEVQQTKLRVKPVPVYPQEAKAQHLEGIVRLRAIIARDGTIANLQVLSGDPILAASAVEAVRRWEYTTTLLNGEPVEVVTDVDVNFTLAK